MGDIVKKWKVLSGENNWEGLLDPIDNNLREYLINYGSHVGAARDSFNDLKDSAGYALCQYPPEVFFSRVGLEKGNPFKYKVTDYLFARLENKEKHPSMSAYIGFVAVSTDEGKLVLGRRDIVVCWRGSMVDIEFYKDTYCPQVSATDIFPNSKALVHHGFHSVYTTKDSTTKYSKMSAREQALAAVRRLVDKYYKADQNESVSITVSGHSLGGALATLNAADIVYNGYNKPTGSTTEHPVASFVFASPRVGNKGFFDVLSGLKNFHLLSIRNAGDPVHDLPPTTLNYVDVGVMLDIGTNGSPYLKKPIKHYHDLNLYLHGISGYQGKDKKFELVVNYDLPLVNKHDDYLLHCFKVPANWWTNVINKGMVQMEDGPWKMDDCVPDPPSG